MNKTNFEHAGYALLFQLLVWAITGDIMAGAMAGAFFFIGREHAQAERRAGCEFKAFKPEYWSLDSVLDIVFPVIAVAVCVAIVVYFQQVK